MQAWYLKPFCVVILLVMVGCTVTPTPPPPPSPTAVITPTPVPTNTITPAVTETTIPADVSLPSLSIQLGTTNKSQGITLDKGGDVDTKVVVKSSQSVETRATGSGQALAASDGNTTPDSYIQFNVDDRQLFGGKPTTHVRLEVDYFDEGTDSFSLQYDAQNGKFFSGGSVNKTNTLTFKTAVFNLCDALFSNRDNGADFRIADNSDGAEFFSAVRVISQSDAGSQTIKVDDFGANPFDDQPDSAAIQAVLDSTCSSDTIVFTSGGGTSGYTGYLIDQTLFLTGMSAKHNLTFTSSDPASHARLRATADLKGFVVRLYARSRISNPGEIDDIDFSNIDIDGGRDVRACFGPDQLSDGRNDNWGSWLPECTASGDPWCMPGVLGMDGGMNWEDTTQNYVGRPAEWTTAVYVHDLTLEKGECGTALAFFSAGGKIENVTIDTAGDHVHVAGCAFTDKDTDRGAWSDGITLFGPGQTVTNNKIINPSDIGIVFFGGKDTVIANNDIQITAGNYGAFGGIALHPWIFGDISGLQIIGNRVTSAGDSRCGGFHTGINLGTHMWGGGCLQTSRPAMFGNPLSCTTNPALDKVTTCTGGQCQLWAYLAPGSTLTMKDNFVSGAHINYLIEGLASFGQFIDENNVSQSPQRSDWEAAANGCSGVRWGPLDKVAHHPALAGYNDLLIHCER